MRLARVGRTGDGHTHHNELTAGPELRHIVIAQGKEYRNDDLPFHIPDFLTRDGPDKYWLEQGVRVSYKGFRRLRALELKPIQTATRTGRYTAYEHNSPLQGVVFHIRVVDTKQAFVQALETPGVHLIYDGHARYGRGPCFGYGGHAPGESWEEGEGPHPNSEGLFRMGYPFIAIEVEDILRHGYKTTLVPSSVDILPQDCNLHDLRAPRSLSEMRGRTIESIHRELLPFVRNAAPTARFWSSGSGRKAHVIVEASWENTASAPDDLGSHSPACRVFAHVGCSSFFHHRQILRDRKAWKRDGNERYSFFTGASTEINLGVYWLYHLLTYDQFNAHQSWDKSLRYALKETNLSLKADGESYRIM